jgi:hypothetical protein
LSAAIILAICVYFDEFERVKGRHFPDSLVAVLNEKDLRVEIDLLRHRPSDGIVGKLRLPNQKAFRNCLAILKTDLKLRIASSESHGLLRMRQDFPRSWKLPSQSEILEGHEFSWPDGGIAAVVILDRKNLTVYYYSYYYD